MQAADASLRSPMQPVQVQSFAPSPSALSYSQLPRVPRPMEIPLEGSMQVADRSNLQGRSPAAIAQLSQAQPKEEDTVNYVQDLDFRRELIMGHAEMPGKLALEIALDKRDFDRMFYTVEDYMGKIEGYIYRANLKVTDSKKVRVMIPPNYGVSPGMRGEVFFRYTVKLFGSTWT